MSRPVKYIASILAAVIVIAAVTGIAFWTAQYDPDAPDPGLFIKGKKVDDPGAMLYIGETPVSFGVYRHYYLLYKSYFATYYGADFFEDDPDGDKATVLKDAVETELVNAYAWLAVAAERGLTLTEEELAEIDATLAEQKETRGDNFERYMQEEMFFQDEAEYAEITKMQKLASKAQTEYTGWLREQYTDELTEETEASYQEENMTAKHILLMVDAELYATDPDQAKADALEKAEDILAQIRQRIAELEVPDGEEGPAPEDIEAVFDEFMHEYSEDGGLETNPDGYTFAEGAMVDVFYDGALALEEYGISEPILSEAENYQGYHIILRLPLDTTGIETAVETAISAKVTELRDEKLAEIQAAHPVTYGEYYDQFRATDIH